MRAIVIQHEVTEGLGLLEPALKAAGYQLVHRFRDVKYEDGAAELVVVLGGKMSLTEPDEHPFLHHELAMLTERLLADRPTLGICLGAQLLARAAGSDVSRGKNGVELGVLPIRAAKGAEGDPVFKGLRPKLPVAHWHEDTFSAVPDGVLLASSDRYTQQAFRIGRSYGFQFHPELSAEAFAKLLEAEKETLAAAGKDVSALKAEAAKLKGSEGELTALIERLVHESKRAVG